MLQYVSLLLKKKGLSMSRKLFLCAAVSISVVGSGSAREQYKEITVCSNNAARIAFEKLMPQERVFAYYLHRAALPGNMICADQSHRHAHEAVEVFESIARHQKKLQKLSNRDAFIQDAKTYLAYLYAFHSPYFRREHANEKRTSARLGLTQLTPRSLTYALLLSGQKNAKEMVDRIKPLVFDDSIEQTLTVPGNIERSAVNIYSLDFTESDYELLDPDQRNGVNRYCFVAQKDGKREPRTVRYAANGKYGLELSVTCYWLDKAREHAEKYPEQFDAHAVKALEYLSEHLKTGDEEQFRKHTIEWLQSKCKIDYNFGFIEYYTDPKAQTGMFQADVTVKSVDVSSLTDQLPAIEKKMPFPVAFKRENMSVLPNASINTKLFAAGDLGPAQIVAAYCLPNYEDIRSKYGSKQIIYSPEKNIMEEMNPDLTRKLFYMTDKTDWLVQHDPEFNLKRDMWTIHVLLHETIGHGSGRLDTHTFKTGERLRIGNKEYELGDKIAMTPSNLKEFLSGYLNTMEELRAEIIAAYVATHHLDVLNKAGFLTEWTKKLGEKQIVEWFIWHIANQGLGRLLNQEDNATEMAGAHAQADWTILNYLADGRGILIESEQKKIGEKEYTVVDVRVAEVKKALAGIKDLMVLVQTIKSTGDGLKIEWLIDTYGKPIKDSSYLRALKENRKAIIGDVKLTVALFPEFRAVIKKDSDELIDVRLVAGSNIIDQNLAFSDIALSRDN